MDEQACEQFFSGKGYRLEEVSSIPEGSSHDIFEVKLTDRTYFIARFEKKSNHAVDGTRYDFHYNGRMTLEREAYLCTLVRETAQLPAPKVVGIYEQDETRCLLVEKMDGLTWKSFVKNNNYSLSHFLQSMTYLGADIAQVQRIKFETFGNVMARGVIEPSLPTFAERLEQIIQLKIQREERTGALKQNELKLVKKYFSDYLNLYRSLTVQEAPVLILADFHATNFLVDEKKGKPCGYVDLEFCQSGLPALEFHLIMLQLMNYFDRETFYKAQEGFFNGFHSNGGKYDIETKENVCLTKMLAGSRFLTAATAYHAVKDGLRDTWSERVKDILFTLIDKSEIDYIGFADIMREKTKQPRIPNLP